jgi:glycogen synthase
LLHPQTVVPSRFTSVRAIAALGALHYGTVPVVSSVGGLIDIAIDIAMHRHRGVPCGHRQQGHASGVTLILYCNADVAAEDVAAGLSRIEPCGMVVLTARHYGTVPVVVLV